MRGSWDFLRAEFCVLGDFGEIFLKIGIGVILNEIEGHMDQDVGQMGMKEDNARFLRGNFVNSQDIH